MIPIVIYQAFYEPLRTGAAFLASRERSTVSNEDDRDRDHHRDRDHTSHGTSKHGTPPPKEIILRVRCLRAFAIRDPLAALWPFIAVL